MLHAVYHIDSSQPAGGVGAWACCDTVGDPSDASMLKRFLKKIKREAPGGSRIVRFNNFTTATTTT